MRLIFLLVFSFIAVFVDLQAQPDVGGPVPYVKPISPYYEITLTAKGATDGQPCLIGNYFFDNTFRVDSTTFKNEQAMFIFKKDPAPGLYFFYANGKIANFVINTDKKLSFVTQYSAFSDSMKITNPSLDKENDLLFSFNAYIKKKQSEAAKIEEMLPLLERAKADTTIINEEKREYQAIFVDIANYSRAQALANSNTFFSKSILASTTAEVPSNIKPRLDNGEYNPDYFSWQRQHYWDTYPFTDSTLLMTDVLARRLESWFNDYTPMHIDSLTNSITLLMDRAAVSVKYKRQIERWMVTKFEKQEQFYGDTLMAFLFDKYMPTADSASISQATWERIQYKVNIFRPTMPGKVAPDIVLRDMTDTIRQLSAINSPLTLVYFFNPNCTNCQEKTPQMANLIRPYLGEGLKVYAVSYEDNRENWVSYIKSLGIDKDWICVYDDAVPSVYDELYAINKMPNIFLLDAQKRVLFKKLSMEDLYEVLQKYYDK